MCGYRIAGDAPLTSILMKLGLYLPMQSVPIISLGFRVRLTPVTRCTLYNQWDQICQELRECRCVSPSTAFLLPMILTIYSYAMSTIRVVVVQF